MKERLQWWWWANAVSVKRLIAGVTATVIVVVLLRRDSDQLLEYLRVLAWPLVALTGILIFREPLLRVLRGVYVKEVSWRGSSVLFEQQVEGELPVSDPAANELENLRIGANVAGALLQAFQIQVDFVRSLGQAPDGLSRLASEGWFVEQISSRGMNREDWDPAGLLDWVLNRGLIDYTAEGNLKRSLLGERLVSLTDSFWYAPKVV